MNDYKELIERLLYYGTEYAIGDNLGQEIDGTGELLLEAKDAIETLTAQLTASETARADLAKRLTLAQQERDVVTKRMIELEQELAQVQAERDAAVKCLEDARACETCEHMDTHPDCDVECLGCQKDCTCRDCRDGSNFKWKGAKEDT